MDDRLERGELCADRPRTISAQAVAVERPVRTRARKALADLLRSARRPVPGARRTTASASNTGTPARLEHLRDGRLAHADRSGERDPDHDGSRPRSRSAPSSGIERHSEDREMVAVDAIEQLHAAPLQPEHADSVADFGPFGIEIGSDEGIGERPDLQRRRLDMAPVERAVAAKRDRAGQLAFPCRRRSADAPPLRPGRAAC